ncbi:cation diffusion facilitator family transporter [Terriglobus tenax]|uniref:cation diffusion facilitator family transporter n=1 Tax=Terriglobus tenax TaxID=1111115 RepID=UPI0021DF66E2|nr:cation diffusion facilitator family transporter [Terriglobus tenax]
MHVHGSPTGKTQRVLQISLVLTALYVLATLWAGIRAHSLALVGEAGHNASDFLAILLSFVAVYFQAKPANDQKTFGYQRAGVLAAFVNGLSLIVVAILIGFAAIGRLYKPVDVEAGTMMIVAALGVAMNGVVALMLWRVGRDLNLRSVFLHMLGDALSTAAVIVGGAAIEWTNLRWIDPVLSLGIAAMILWSSIGIVRETLNILLEGTPRNLCLADVREAMRDVPGVQDVHDLHVWSLGSSSYALASHVTVGDVPMQDQTGILDAIRLSLRKGFHITHTTIQFEMECCPRAEENCCAPPEEEHEGCSHTHAH